LTTWQYIPEDSELYSLWLYISDCPSYSFRFSYVSRKANNIPIITNSLHRMFTVHWTKVDFLVLCSQYWKIFELKVAKFYEIYFVTYWYLVWWVFFKRKTVKYDLSYVLSMSYTGPIWTKIKIRWWQLSLNFIKIRLLVSEINYVWLYWPLCICFMLFL
jgi:hypothetical protein